MTAFLTALSLCIAAAACLGGVYLVVAVVAVRRFAGQKTPALGAAEPVTILKPVFGLDPGLYDNLASFCRQDYAGPVQIVIGAHSAADPALAVVRQVAAEFPAIDITIVIDGRLHGANRKVSNLINMMAGAAHDILLISDSDMRVDEGYLGQIVAGLQRPNVGIVTTLYRGRPIGGISSRLACAFINYGFIPSVLVGRLLHAAPYCSGSTIAFRRDTLTRIGGFESLVNHIADDHLMGALVEGLGMKVALARPVVDTIVFEPDLSAMIAHELRWQRTIKAIAPAGLAASVITNPVPLALLALVLGGFAQGFWLVLAGVLAARLTLLYTCELTFELEPVGLWLLPFRDGLSQLILVASFLGKRVVWRETRLRLDRDGEIESAP